MGDPKWQGSWLYFFLSSFLHSCKTQDPQPPKWLDMSCSFFSGRCCQDLFSWVEVLKSILLLVSPMYLHILQGKSTLCRFLCCWCLEFCSWGSHWVHLCGFSCLTSVVALVSLGLLSMFLASSWGWNSYCHRWFCLCISRLQWVIKVSTVGMFLNSFLIISFVIHCSFTHSQW